MFRYVRHDVSTCVTRCTHVCDMTHLCVWYDALICVTWCIYVRHIPFTCVTWRIHVCDMTHSCVWDDAFMRVTWRIDICDMTHSCVWHDALICVTWPIRTCNKTQPERNVWIHHLLFSLCFHFLTELPWVRAHLCAFVDASSSMYVWRNGKGRGGKGACKTGANRQIHAENIM